ncbi:MAG: sensor histidine kinase [Clostridia bacterium]|jgi:sensor histidine kinase YesM|nr:sensor histidine kinase [Clostridia bacterium]
MVIYLKTYHLYTSFKTKIVILFTLVTLLALSLQTVLFQYSSSKLIYQEAKRSSLNALTNMQDDLYTFIKSLENDILQIYNRSDFITDLTEEVNIETIKSRYNKIAYQMALSDFSPSQNVNALYIYNIDNKLISFYRHATTPKYTYPEDIYNHSMSNNASIVKDYAASDNKITLISSYYNANRGQNMIRFVMKIYGKNATRKIGYIVCDIDQKSFLKRINKYIYSPKQIVWLQPIGDHPTLQVGDLTERDKSYYNEITSLIFANAWSSKNNIDNHENVFFQIPQKRYNLVAFSLTPHFLLEENQKLLTQNLIIIGILLIITFSFLSAIISEFLTNSLTKMMYTINQIKNGNTTLRMTDLKNDEFGKLGEEFNEMLDKIENLIMQEYESKLLINNAKYKALQAQINPHFLYNTLDTMSSIASMQQCHSVSALCKALSNQFRYSLDMKNPLATIESELLHLKNYLHIMNVRMQNSIAVEISLDNNLLHEQIPRISIQPLVENSILHGLKNKYGDKKIWIEVKALENDIVISVKDNGVGMNEHEVCLSLQNSELDALEKNSSIGLNNINARVKILFGKEYGVKVESTINVGSTVFLYIPRMKERC